MSKYINVDRLKEFIKQNGFVYANTLDSFATEDVAPVVHGRWGDYEAFPLTPSLNGHPCSECGTHFNSPEIVFMDYCPRCGAKMDKEFT